MSTSACRGVGEGVGFQPPPALMVTVLERLVVAPLPSSSSLPRLLSELRRYGMDILLQPTPQTVDFGSAHRRVRLGLEWLSHMCRKTGSD